MLRALTGTFTDAADAVRVGDVISSWQELSASAQRVAAEVAGARVVAVTATATMSTIVSVCGAIAADVTVVLIPPDSGERERQHILRDSAAGLELVDGHAVDLPTTALPTVAPDTALLLYTSGTTGAPKGVELTQAALAADLDALAEAWSWTSDDRLVHGLPLFHVHGLVLGVLGPLRLGARLHHTVRPTPEASAAAHGTMLFGVPTVWSRIVQDPASARALSDARLLVSGSAPLPAPVFDGLHSLTGHEVVERYGMTETLITVSARSDGERKASHVGTPLAGISTRLRDEHQHEVPADGASIGELQVRGPTMFSGYLNQPEATRESYTDDGWFRTGDIAAISPDGSHRIVGRASLDLIKTGGYRVGAGEVEDALLAHPGVREAAVIGVDHSDLGQAITAYVVADNLSETALINHVAASLSAHKRPRTVVFVDALPRNAMGKVQKQLLREDGR